MPDSPVRIYLTLDESNALEFTLSRQVTRKQWQQIIAVIELAEDSCISEEETNGGER